MDKINQYLAVARAYDVGGTELPSFIQKKIDQCKALADTRAEIEQIPRVDLNASDLKEQYKAQALALSLREGARLINHARYERLLEERLSSALDLGLNRLIKSLSEKVAADLNSLDDPALERLLLLVDNLPNSLTTTGLLPATSRLLALVQIDDSKLRSVMAASAIEFSKATRDRKQALQRVKDGEYFGLSLAFVGSLDELATRRERMASLLHADAAA